MIFINTQFFGKVWNVTKPEGKNYLELRISTREKKQDETVAYSSWFPRVIGHAYNSLKDIKEGDRITVTKAKITNEPYTDAEGKTKSAFKFVILEEKIDDSEPTTNSTTTPSEDATPNNTSDDSCPW